MGHFMIPVCSFATSSLNRLAQLDQPTPLQLRPIDPCFWRRTRVLLPVNNISVVQNSMEKHPEEALGQNKGLIHVQVSAEAVAYCSSPKRTFIQQTDCHYWLVHWDYQPNFSGN